MMLALTISCAVLGVHLTIDEILQHFTGWTSAEWYDETHECLGDGAFKKTWITHLAKPLFYCATCMASIWGSFFYVCIAPMHHQGVTLLAWYVPTIAMVALFNTVIYKLFNKL
jgi:hypothetical protein